MFRRLLITGLALLVIAMGLSAYHEANPEPPSLALPQTRAERRQADARAFCEWKTGTKAKNMLTVHEAADFALCLDAQR